MVEEEEEGEAAESGGAGEGDLDLLVWEEEARVWIRGGRGALAEGAGTGAWRRLEEMVVGCC